MNAEAFIDRLDAANIAHYVLENDGGCAVFLPAAARMIGLWADAEGPNVLWTHPDLFLSAEAASQGWSGLHPGGPGGDRLWHGPEHQFFWEGPPQADLSNWRVPDFFDPGGFRAETSREAVRFHRTLEMPDGATARIVRSFSVDDSDAPGFQLREEHSVELVDATRDTQLDLWVITQVPAETTLLVPARHPVQPGVAFEEKPGDIARLARSIENTFVWNVTGVPLVKGHLPADAVLGTLACFRDCGDGCGTSLLREFSPEVGAAYRDGLLPDQVGNQCVQFWDGLGYGEIECHSPTATPDNPMVTETHRIEAYSGPITSVSDRVGKTCGVPPPLLFSS